MMAIGVGDAGSCERQKGSPAGGKIQIAEAFPVNLGGVENWGKIHNVEEICVTCG